MRANIITAALVCLSWLAQASPTASRSADVVAHDDAVTLKGIPVEADKFQLQEILDDIPDDPPSTSTPSSLSPRSLEPRERGELVLSLPFETVIETAIAGGILSTKRNQTYVINVMANATLESIELRKLPGYELISSVNPKGKTSYRFSFKRPVDEKVYIQLLFATGPLEGYLTVRETESITQGARRVGQSVRQSVKNWSQSLSCLGGGKRGQDGEC